MTELKRKHKRALIALRDGKQMNTSLRFALYQIGNELVEFHCAEGSDNVRPRITPKGMRVANLLSQLPDFKESE